MIFYPSKCHNRLNGRAFAPEAICGRAMLNPYYAEARLSRPARYLLDSQAFQTLRPADRMLPWTALAAQLTMERAIEADLQARGYAGGHPAEAILHYDQMAGVDEQIIAGVKVKRRGTEDTARLAIAETLRAAEYYSRQRARVRGALCFAAQGVTPRQYVQECVLPLLDLMQPGDWFAFGGFCIIGQVPSLKPLFVETVAAVLPLLRKRGIRRAHLLGVGVTDMVRYAAAQGRMHEIVMSLDTSSIEVNSTLGKVFDGHAWHKRYSKAQKYQEYHPRDLAEANLLYYDAFCRSLDARDAAATVGYTSQAPVPSAWRSEEASA